MESQEVSARYNKSWFANTEKVLADAKRQASRVDSIAGAKTATEIKILEHMLKHFRNGSYKDIPHLCALACVTNNTEDLPPIVETVIQYGNKNAPVAFNDIRGDEPRKQYLFDQASLLVAGFVKLSIQKELAFMKAFIQRPPLTDEAKNLRREQLVITQSFNNFMVQLYQHCEEQLKIIDPSGESKDSEIASFKRRMQSVKSWANQAASLYDAISGKNQSRAL